jgi:hypothetical protein
MERRLEPRRDLLGGADRLKIDYRSVDEKADALGEIAASA